MSTGGLTMIKNTVAKLPDSERKIAEYILNNPHTVVNSTAGELGRLANASSAAVIRLCKSIGVSGFQELKVRVAGDLARDTEQGYRDIETNETIQSIVKKTASNSIQSLSDTAELVNYKEVERAVLALIEAKNIHFFGIGASHIIAIDAQQKFLRINKNATAFADSHLAATLIANASKDDVVVGISFSGETPEVSNVLSLAKNRGVKTISLTKYGQSTVSSLADICLYTSYSQEAPFRSAATSSRLAQLYVIDVLFLSIAAQQYDQTIEYIDKTRDAIQFLKDKK
ncbi:MULTISPECIES: MurR/RpiR family transcriptional regulator [Priestia]|uniref:MurR/RpiR family transcriptional regulator n=1 Tax=Priestia TaxID=2800373 RepID=UPI00064F714F|nr:MULTISPECIES: MurR/RpiR family transcriptional regulator [Priestia]KML28111.1 RpiR family transcriptional regulator [Priestia aryabhattai]KMN93735.1 RpiR family transcriptional regulator [Priestia aryabhattai]MBK0006949.1 MurR/RpiR family transcriptional regulator [Bacillus sp. S35]